jgi:cytochrome c-type biogenesis protein CcmH/NrfG
LTLLGRIERARGNVQDAITAFEQAIQIAGLEGGAAAELVEMLGQHKRTGHYVDFSGYVNALTQYVGHHSVIGASEVRVYQELARVLDSELGDRERAVAVLGRALEASPNDLSLRAELANVLERSGNYPAAIDAYRQVIELDVMRADAYRGVARALEQIDRQGDALAAIAPLMVLGAATESEQLAVAARAMRTPMLDRAIELDEMIALGLPSAVDPTGALLASIADALDRVDNPNIEQYGLVSRERIGSRSGHPMRTLADRIGAVVGAEEFDFYVSNAVGQVVVEPGDPPIIIAPAALNQMSEPVQIFALGRVLIMLGRKWQAVERLPASHLENWILAAVGVSEGREDAQTRRLVKALPWGRKGRVEEAGDVYARAARPSVNDFVSRARSAALRIAAVMSDDLPGSIGWLQRVEAQSSNVMGQDLLSHWTSEAAYAIRRRLSIG